VKTSTRPGPKAVWAAAGLRNRRKVSASIAPLTPMPEAIRRDAVSSRLPKRRVVPSAMTGACEPS